MDPLAIPTSKSQLCRWLVLNSFLETAFPAWAQAGCGSGSEDVRLLGEALSKSDSREIWIGNGAAPLRFLALRLSREVGTWTIRGTPELFARPQEGLTALLRVVGSEVRVTSDSALELTSRGWVELGSVNLQSLQGALSLDSTSQLASALALASQGLWDWSQFAKERLEKPGVSGSYAQMTLTTLAQWGSPGQLSLPPLELLEVDASSSFAIAALAAVKGDVWVPAPLENSLQGDSVFPKILEKLGARVSQKGGRLRIRSARLVGSEFDLRSTPDLFPVLSVLAGTASGPSVLYGAPHLKFKETNRIKEVTEILRAMGRFVIPMDDGLAIASEFDEPARLALDPRGDHRLVMAAQVACRAGFEINILNKDCVSKSFRGYWSWVDSLK